jgi:DNA-binding NarL/FixJ family response regulator
MKSLAEAAAEGGDARATRRIIELAAEIGQIASDAHTPGNDNGPAVQDSSTVALRGLTERQREIVERLLDGQRVAAIAAALFISQSTVRNHLSAAYRGFGVHSQSELLERLRPAG